MMRMHVLLLAVALSLVGTSAPAREPSGFGSDVQALARYKSVAPKIVAAKAAFERKDFARAEKNLQSVLAVIPDLSDAHFLMARVLYAQQRYPAALESIVRAKETFASTAAFMAGSRDERIAQLQKDKSVQLANLGREMSRPTPPGGTSSMAAIGAIQQAISAIERQLSDLAVSAPASIPAEFSFIHGNILLRNRDLAGAIAQYQEALRIDPAYGDAANNLASLYYEAKLYEQARAVIETIEAHGGAVMPALKAAVLAALGA